MGLMRFRVFPPERITEEVVQQAYLSGFDRVAWPVRISVEGEQLLIQRSVSDSAKLNVPWPVERYGRLTVASATLIERPEPYLLPLELARGSITQVRNQLSEWQTIGLSVPKAATARISEAVRRFSLAAVEQDEVAVSADHAEAALRLALDAGELLAAAYTEQVLTVRGRNEGRLASFLGANLGATLLDNNTARHFLQTFNAAQVPLPCATSNRWKGVFPGPPATGKSSGARNMV